MERGNILFLPTTFHHTLFSVRKQWIYKIMRLEHASIHSNVFFLVNFLQKYPPYFLSFSNMATVNRKQHTRVLNVPESCSGKPGLVRQWSSMWAIVPIPIARHCTHWTIERDKHLATAVPTVSRQPANCVAEVPDKFSSRQTSCEFIYYLDAFASTARTT